MSAIASFYLVRIKDVDQLKKLATQPVGPGKGGKWYDPYFEFLSANGRKLEDFDWSGYLIGSEVCFYLESVSVDIEQYYDKPLTDFFSKARESSTYLFRAESAGRLAKQIENHWPDEATLNDFLDSPDMKYEDEDSAPVEAVLVGLRIMKAWLSQVDQDHVGLLNIG